jgi:hypothetical protein
MPIDSPNHHRRLRYQAIANWAAAGVLARRPAFPVEQAFAERLNKLEVPFFRPVALPYSDDRVYNTQVSYIVDALDLLPKRPDVAFDSVWKAFEVVCLAVGNTNITDSLDKVLTGRLVDREVLNLLCSAAPAQACEFMYARAVAATEEGAGLMNSEDKRWHRLKSDANWPPLLASLKRRNATGQQRRDGAMLLRRALQGDELDLSGEKIRLSEDTRGWLLVGCFLYTARNERFHGLSFSPFISSAAKVSTFTHPYFAFLGTYGLLCSLWSSSDARCGVGLDSDVVLFNVQENLESARLLFGRHWTGG